MTPFSNCIWIYCWVQVDRTQNAAPRWWKGRQCSLHSFWSHQGNHCGIHPHVQRKADGMKDKVSFVCVIREQLSLHLPRDLLGMGGAEEWRATSSWWMLHGKGDTDTSTLHDGESQSVFNSKDLEYCLSSGTLIYIQKLKINSQVPGNDIALQCSSELSFDGLTKSCTSTHTPYPI